MDKKQNKVTVEPINKDNRLGKLLKKKRTNLGYSQAVVAENTGVSVAEICRIELGERANPSMAIVMNLGKALKLDEEEFIEFLGYKELEDIEYKER